MKKILLKINLLALLTLVFSCTKSDDNSSNVDSIIGKWEYSTQFENDIQFTQNDCQPSTIQFTSNGNRTDKYYDQNLANECVLVDNVNLTWSKINVNTYQFNQNGDIYTENVTFENGNNKLILENSDDDGNGNIVIYKFVYNRIN